METQTLQELIFWAVTEIRELDELCRSMVPGYGPLDSEDMIKLSTLKDAAKKMEKTNV